MVGSEVSWVVVHAPWIGALLALGCLLLCLRINAKRRLIEALPTSKTAGVFIGLTEVKGSAESEKPLTSYLAGVACVQYAWKIEEHWTRTHTETKQDAQGKTRQETKTTTGWSTVASGKEQSPFYLRDDTGVIRVVPEGARIEGERVFSKTCGRSDPLYYGKGPERAVADSDHRRRFVETAVPLHGQLYVLGQAREREDIVAPEIAADPIAPMFLISTRSEEWITRGMAWQCRFLGLLGALFAVGGCVLRDQGLYGEMHSFGLYGAAFGGYAAALFGGWFWMVFNTLVGLRQRVNQGFAQIETELKRRHDLIPRLVQVVQGMREHEAGVQERLAELRAESAATAPGAPGPDPHGCASRVIALAEAYPELKSNEQFGKLSEELIRTEQRIALARDYFNSIATNFNTRIEVVPDRLVVALAGMKPRALLQAADFERAPVRVALAE